MKTPQRVLIMAGGTGGHVFPGLVLAAYLRQQHIEVHWLGTRQGIEARLVPEAGIPLHFLSIGGLRGKGILPLLKAPFKIASAILQAQRVIKETNPDIVVGMGGFASGPGGVASWLMRKPLVVHEQNAKAGLTNKLLSCIAKKVLEGFPSVFASSKKVYLVGNPVRSAIEALPPPQERWRHISNRPLNLLVLGGSLGAKALNEMAPQALALLPSAQRPDVMHQTGEKDIASVKNYYESKGIRANVTAFIKDMAQAYAWADIVLCRAGALTVAELCAAGRGAILIPFPHAVDDHQTANASFMVKENAAICVQQAVLTPEKLSGMIQAFVNSPEKCLKMAEKAYSLRNIHVPERIFDILCEVVTSQESVS